MDLYFDSIHSDTFLSCIIGGIKRAEQRFHDRLNTVDEQGNLVRERATQPSFTALDTEGQ